MRRKIITLIALAPLTIACNKTSELYENYAYNSPDFMKNYYTEFNGVDKLAKNEVKVIEMSANNGYVSQNSLDAIRPEDNKEKYPWYSFDDYEKEFGRHNNLSKIDNSFAYGYLSKLYDGRVRCESKFQLSRVQLDKYGYATFFPKKLESYKYFAFSLRGATDYENSATNPSPLAGTVYLDVHVNFYKHITNSDKYNVVTFNLNNVAVPCDSGGDTNLVTIYMADDIDIDGVTNRSYRYDIRDAVAMSMSYELKTTRSDLTDDSKVEKDHHFAVMLYEVLFPKSVWR